MSVQVSKKEFEAALKLNSAERYEYTVNKVADWEEVWSLKVDEGWALYSDSFGQTLIPIWPARQFAESCCKDEWQSYRPESISLDDWLEKWIPGIENDDFKIAVFSLPSDQGVVVEPGRFADDLDEVLEQFEQ